jgi:transposase
MKEQNPVRGTNQYCNKIDGTNYKTGYGHTVFPMDDQMTNKQIKLMDIHTDQTGASWHLNKHVQGRMNKQNRYNINRIVKKRTSILDGNIYFPKSDRKAYNKGTHHTITMKDERRSTQIYKQTDVKSLQPLIG